MTSTPPVTRRSLLRLIALSLLGAGVAPHLSAAGGQAVQAETMLSPAGYDQVELLDGLPLLQRENCIDVLLQISDDSMLKPFRERAGEPAPGLDIGGWYDYFAGYDWQKGVERGFAPGHCFGQWLSALARGYAITGSARIKEKVDSLVNSFGQAISPRFFQGARFQAYTYDKIVIGLIDAHRYANCQAAMAALEKTTAAVEPFLPKQVEDRDKVHPGQDISFSWDEPYTIPENLFIAYREGAGEKYLQLARRFLLDKAYFEPLAAGQNVLIGKHAYSYMNALGSAMQAYLTTGSQMHLRAARNAFQMILQDQSFATGGWGPDEKFQKPGTGFLGESLHTTHNSFETPCGSYAHLKLTNYLTCVTGDSRFGDSAEQIIYNTVLGAKPLKADGHAFYYADYNTSAQKVYSSHTCPCCAGTLPQVACDYGRHAYFFAGDQSAVYVNLYFNSALKWQRQGRICKLVQKSNYPMDGRIVLKVEARSPETFVLNLRIPAWTEGSYANVAVNGERVGETIARGIAGQESKLEAVEPGKFFALRRTWKDGDTVELLLPRPLRLVPVDAQHPDLVALVCGPRVLFAVREEEGAGPALSSVASAKEPEMKAVGKPFLTFSAEQLLGARRSGYGEEWVATVANGRKIRFLPYTAIQDQVYSTYQKLV